MASLPCEQMVARQAFEKLLDPVVDFFNLPHLLAERIPLETQMEMGLDGEEWNTIADALRAEVGKKVDAAVTTILSVLREHLKERRDSWWEGYVLACLAAERKDLIARYPAAEQTAVRLQAEALLRRRKPPE